MPNSVEALLPLAQEGLLQDMCGYCDAVVFNTFGFFLHDRTAKRLLCAPECLLAQFMEFRSWLHFVVGISMTRVLIGVDTQSILYESEETTPYVKRWRLINHTQVVNFVGPQYHLSGDSVQ